MGAGAATRAEIVSYSLCYLSVGGWGQKILTRHERGRQRGGRKNFGDNDRYPPPTPTHHPLIINNSSLTVIDSGTTICDYLSAHETNRVE